MTNGDRIRSMTDEELADFLISEDAEEMILHFSGIILAARVRKNFENLLGECTLVNPCGKELSSAEMQCWLSSETTKETTKVIK